MEDNNILLMRVLKIHYKDKLHILDEALKVIKEYSNKAMSTQSEYDLITLTLNNMLDDLPSEILKYFLTMVPFPKNTENLSKNKEDITNIRGILLNYLNEGLPPLVPLQKLEPKIVKKESPKEIQFKNTENASKRPILRPKRKYLNKNITQCKTLLDICAEYVVLNLSTLRQDYQTMKEKMWKMVNSNKYDGKTLEELYIIIRDLNKKLKWLRLLDNDEITAEIIQEEYGTSDIFIKERQLESVLEDDPLEISSELQNALMYFANK